MTEGGGSNLRDAIKEWPLREGDGQRKGPMEDFLFYEAVF